jgi:hypothetical protein
MDGMTSRRLQELERRVNEMEATTFYDLPLDFYQNMTETDEFIDHYTPSRIFVCPVFPPRTMRLAAVATVGAGAATTDSLQLGLYKAVHLTTGQRPSPGARWDLVGSAEQTIGAVQWEKLSEGPATHVFGTGLYYRYQWVLPRETTLYSHELYGIGFRASTNDVALKTGTTNPVNYRCQSSTSVLSFGSMDDMVVPSASAIAPIFMLLSFKGMKALWR